MLPRIPIDEEMQNYKKFIVKRLYRHCNKQLNPRMPKNLKERKDSISRDGRFKYNFAGGCNDNERTFHENIFAVLNPTFERQVVFGTGKNGYKDYHTKKYVVDFLDRENNIAYEIDGNSHDTPKQQIVDETKGLFLLRNYGIDVIRIKNRDVACMLWDVIAKFVDGIDDKRVFQLMEYAVLGNRYPTFLET